MQPLAASPTTALVIVNVILGLLCAVAVALVAVAAYRDAKERRRWRDMVPDCWPPPGVDPDAAYVTPGALPGTNAPDRPRHPRTPNPR